MLNLICVAFSVTLCIIAMENNGNGTSISSIMDDIRNETETETQNNEIDQIEDLLDEKLVYDDESDYYYNEDDVDYPSVDYYNGTEDYYYYYNYDMSNDTEIPIVKPKIVCYFSSWAWYRPTNGKMYPEDIDSNLCTHIIYSFAVLDNETLLMKSPDTWTDIDNHFYQRVTHLQSISDVKVLLALGGWADSDNDKYSRMIADPEARQKFIKHCVEYLEQNGFAGLDLDYEYVGCWQGDCTQGSPDEKNNFARFVVELYMAFLSRGLLLSAAVPINKVVIDTGYDIPTLSAYLDFINLMTYDYAGGWMSETAHHSPLKSRPGTDDISSNIEWAISYWIQNGAAPEKLILGIPTYGVSFTLSDPENHGLSAPVTGRGLPGQFTDSAGTLAFYEICDRVLNENWETYQDSEMVNGPYSWSGNQWVGYDSPVSVIHKVKMIKHFGLGGAMVWTLDFDDYKGVCGLGKFPLVEAIRQSL